ncbi:MAG TPA: hypothetical protein VGC86_02095 [Afipia sp.]
MDEEGGTEIKRSKMLRLVAQEFFEAAFCFVLLAALKCGQSAGEKSLEIRHSASSGKGMNLGGVITAIGSEAIQALLAGLFVSPDKALDSNAFPEPDLK